MKRHSAPIYLAGAVLASGVAAVSLASWRAIGAHDGPMSGLLVVAVGAWCVVAATCFACLFVASLRAPD